MMVIAQNFNKGFKIALVNGNDIYNTSVFTSTFCSFTLTFNNLLVSPTYILSQLVQSIEYLPSLDSAPSRKDITKKKKDGSEEKGRDMTVTTICEMHN